MKSTTLRRANLSKEKIQALENIAKYRRQTQIANAQQKQAVKSVAPQIKERDD